MPTLYRFLDSHEAAVAHMEGHFRFSAFAHFQEIEDTFRNDPLEGKASYQILNSNYVHVANDSHPTQPIFLLSLTESPICSGFGDYRITVNDPEALRMRIASALPKTACVFLDKVEYGKPATLPQEMSGFERLQRAWFQKPHRHQAEAEWRFIIVLAPDLKIANRVLQLRLGDCSDLLDGPNWVKEISHKASLEALKKPEQMFQPDVRSTNLIPVMGITQGNLFSWMQQVALQGAAPKDVRELYDVARNLFLYSWYQYRFSMIAAQTAISAVEMALRTRFKAEGIDTKTAKGTEKTLRPLLSDAVTRGWISDHGLGHWLPETISPEAAAENSYSKNLAEILPKIRNSFAHGTSSYLDQASVVPFFGRSASMIDQLFPARESDLHPRSGPR